MFNCNWIVFTCCNGFEISVHVAHYPLSLVDNSDGNGRQLGERVLGCLTFIVSNLLYFFSLNIFQFCISFILYNTFLIGKFANIFYLKKTHTQFLSNKYFKHKIILEFKSSENIHWMWAKRRKKHMLLSNGLRREKTTVTLGNRHKFVKLKAL